MVGGVEGKNRDKSQRPMILRKIKDKTVSLELVKTQRLILNEGMDYGFLLSAH